MDRQLSRDLNRKYLRRMNYFSDLFFKVALKGNKKLLQFIVRILFEDFNELKDIVINEIIIQDVIEDVDGSKGIIADVVFTDTEGRVYILEVQNKKSGMSEKRMRYELAKHDAKLLKKGEDFKDLKDAVYIVIANYNMYPNENKKYYTIERKISNLNNQSFNDGSTIIVFNGKYRSGEKKLTSFEKLMADFRNENPETMYFDLLKDTARELK